MTSLFCLSPLRPTSLSFLYARLKPENVICLFIVTRCKRSLEDLFKKKRDTKKKRTSESNQRPAASVGVAAAAVSLLTGVWRLCVQKKRRSTIRGGELSLRAFEWQNVPPPMNTKGSLLPLFITQLFLGAHIYTYIAEAASGFPFLISWLPALFDFCCFWRTRHCRSGAKSAHWWVAGKHIYKQGLVILYLLFELLSRVLWRFLNSMRIWL